MFSFNVKIDGENVSPETTSIEDLIDTLATLRTAIVCAAVDAGSKKQDVFLSLSKISKKCNLLTITENEAARAGTLRVTTAIRTRDLSLVPSGSRKAIRHLWKKAASRQWTIAVQNSGPPAIIDPQHAAPSERYIKGNTTIFAKIMRVGGASPTVLVQLQNGDRRTFAIINHELAQRIGGRLYEHVVLVGEAKWLRVNRRLADFRVTGIGKYNELSANPSEALANLSRVIGHHWDGVDVDEYLRDERLTD